MGACVSSKITKTPLPTIEQTIMQMKLAQKRFNRQSSKAFEQQKQKIKQAKMALNKNNQEGAKMYLQAAASKHTQGNNLQRMALKMQTLVRTIKNSSSNQVMIEQFNKLGQIMKLSQNQTNIPLLAENLNKFQMKMDELLVNGKVLDEMFHHGDDPNKLVQEMMETLKCQIALDNQNQLRTKPNINPNNNLNINHLNKNSA